jgi:hypothetical protein
MLPRLLTSALWFFPSAMLVVIAFVMWRRGLVPRFPLFFSYILLVPIRDLVLALLPPDRRQYSLVYWWGEGVVVFLALGVIFELVGYFVRTYPFLGFFLRVFSVAGVLGAALALGLLLGGKGPSGADLAYEWIIYAERSVRFMQVCLLILVIALMSRLGLTWRNHSLGIAAGFGLYAAIDLVLLELRAHLHVLTDNSFVLLRSTAYNLGVLIWAAYFLLTWGEGPINRLPDNDLAQWNDELNQKVDKWYRR